MENGGTENGKPVSGGRKPEFLVFLFALIPGAGQMYLGLMRRGVEMMALFFGTLFVSETLGAPLGDLWPMLIGPVTWFYSFFDTFRLAGMLAREEPVMDEPVFSKGFLQKNAKYIGWSLILLGGLGILRRLSYLIPSIPTHLWGSFVSVLMVGLGIWLLLKERV